MVNNQLLSHNRILNFILGDQDKKASLGFKKHTIERFLNKGEQFIYLRRYKTELKEINSYFDDVISYFPNNELCVKGKEFWIDRKMAGWAIPLSAWHEEKSNEYPRVTTILFENFIRNEKHFGKYLHNETGSLLNLMDTVVRTRDNLQCFCIDSKIDIVNPYFIYFNLVPNLKQKLNVYDDIAIEFYDEEKAYKLNFTQGFINKEPYERTFLFKIYNEHTCLGCWYDAIDHSLLISNDYDKKSKRFIRTKTTNLKETMIGIKEMRKVFSMEILLELCMNGNVNFSSEKVRDSFFHIFKSMMR